MQRISNILTALIIGATAVFLIGYLTSIASTPVNKDIPSIKEFQSLLNQLEPNAPINVDGRLGPETQRKWDRVYFNQNLIENRGA